MITEKKSIPFNRPYMTGKELFYIAEAKFGNALAGDGPFTKKCHQWLESHFGIPKALLTHSCTAALEMAALLLDIQPGDEVIMPSFTFVSTANAFVLRGGVPVLVDIRADTLNLDESRIEAAITPRTRAIVPVHYAGVSCNMTAIMDIARRHKLKVVEDAAQGVMSRYQGRALGAIGDLAAYSFHETKNVISGEGGALLINDPELVGRAEIIREKGTDRSRFFRGQVDKYTWQEVGSSFLPGELTAAFLWAQLEEAEAITAARLASWDYYYHGLSSLAASGRLRLPIIPADCQHNAHMFYVILGEGVARDELLLYLREQQILSVFHYVPLHASPAGQRYGRVDGSMVNTVTQSEKLIRLPLYMRLKTEDQDRVIAAITKFMS
ncbi:MAG: dTDP-4-amino-4,6-dideoxygalactose transaminase [Alphaproteobacteria bacterium]|nr:dTDP-4-amino-4,6-dideoxygalactose transaminase [Alphaproteobacteria bacterium]